MLKHISVCNGEIHQQKVQRQHLPYRVVARNFADLFLAFGRNNVFCNQNALCLESKPCSTATCILNSLQQNQPILQVLLQLFMHFQLYFEVFKQNGSCRV